MHKINPEQMIASYDTKSNITIPARKKNFFQPKLSIHQPDDTHEQEADNTAEKVIQMKDKDSSPDPAFFFKPFSFSHQSYRYGTIAEEKKQGQHEKVNFSNNSLSSQSIRRKENPVTDNRILGMTDTPQISVAPPTAVIQRRPGDKEDIDQQLNNFSNFSGRQRNKVSENDEEFKAWQKRVAELKSALYVLIETANWAHIRKTVYSKESAPKIASARMRHNDHASPDLTGLGSITAIDRFAAAMRPLITDWSKLKNAGARTKVLTNIVSGEMTAASVPPFKEVVQENLKSKGAFSHAHWKFHVNRELVNNEELTSHNAGDLTNTALHESRHAEQAFVAARYSAGQHNLTAPEIVAKQNIPHDIAAQAVKQKFTPETNDMLRAFGERMYEAEVVNKVANQAISDDNGKGEMAARRETAKFALYLLSLGGTKQAVKTGEAAKKSLEQQIDIVKEKYHAYREIPYEKDAHEAGDAAELSLLNWSDKPDFSFYH